MVTLNVSDNSYISLFLLVIPDSVIPVSVIPVSIIAVSSFTYFTSLLYQIPKYTFRVLYHFQLVLF